MKKATRQVARPGVEAEELEPRQTEGGGWRRLAVRFPGEIATHSAVQTLYFDGDGLLNASPKFPMLRQLRSILVSRHSD